MRLESFTVGYSIGEDRLLLQAVGDGDTQSFWITRRAALMIAEGIQKALTEQHLKFGGGSVAPGYLDEILAFERTVATQKNPPKTGTVQNSVKTAPILLYQIGYSAENANDCVFNLTDSNGQGHGYRLKKDMLHALLNLIQTQCDQAGWGLKLVAPFPPGLPAELLH